MEEDLGIGADDFAAHGTPYQPRRARTAQPQPTSTEDGRDEARQTLRQIVRDAVRKASKLVP